MRSRGTVSGSPPGESPGGGEDRQASPEPADETDRAEGTRIDRERLGCDLHDNLNDFVAVSLMLESLRRRIAPIDSEAAAMTERVQHVLASAIEGVRQLSHAMAPAFLFDNDLRPALDEVARAFAAAPGVRVSIACPTPCRLTSTAAIEHLYRIAQEAIQNAIRHGKAGHVHLQVTCGDAHLEMTVADDGVGIPEAPLISHGLGLKLMHHRAALIGGTLDIRRGDPAGTLVACRLPVGPLPAED